MMQGIFIIFILVVLDVTEYFLFFILIVLDGNVFSFVFLYWSYWMVQSIFCSTAIF